MVAQKGFALGCAGGRAASAISGGAFVFYGESLALSDLVLNACSEAGFTPTIVGAGARGPLRISWRAGEAGVGIALLHAPYWVLGVVGPFGGARWGQAARCQRITAGRCRAEIHWDMAVGWRRNGYIECGARGWRLCGNPAGQSAMNSARQDERFQRAYVTPRRVNRSGNEATRQKKKPVPPRGQGVGVYSVLRRCQTSAGIRQSITCTRSRSGGRETYDGR